MKNFLARGILLIIVLLVTPHVFGAVSAAQLEFESTTTSIRVGETVDIKVVVNASGEKITSTDAYVTYDASILQAQSVTDGTFFPTVFNDITTQRVYVAGLVDDPSTFKENTGTVATITFKALKDGTAALAYKCETGASESSKIIKNDFNATNIIDCAKNETTSIAVGAGSTTTETTPAPTELPQSGVFENVVKFGGAGLALVVIGIALRFL